MLDIGKISSYFLVLVNFFYLVGISYKSFPVNTLIGHPSGNIHVRIDNRSIE